MNTIKKFLLGANIFNRKAENRPRKHRLVLPLVIITGLMLSFTVQAEGPVPYQFKLVPASDAINACLPKASATVMIFPKGELRGVDTLDLKAEGLPPNTAFTVFLTNLANIPFGASQYIAEFTTNEAGRGGVRVDAIIEEAFAIVGGVPGRQELNHIVIWFADPAGDDVCFGPGGGPVTPFDGDGQAGGTVLSSKNFLPGAPLP